MVSLEAATSQAMSATTQPPKTPFHVRDQNPWSTSRTASSTSIPSAEGDSASP